MRPGVAYNFWLRVERERTSQGMTKLELWEAMKARAGDGPTPARSTIDKLRETTRPPQPRIVRALADVLGIPWAEAQELAGLVPPGISPEATARDGILRAADLNQAEKSALLNFLDVLQAAKGNQASQGGGETTQMG